VKPLLKSGRTHQKAIKLSDFFIFATHCRFKWPVELLI
jgi:hypothetical protein